MQRLVNVQKNHLLAPLFDALASESDPAVRKFLLILLAGLGRDAAVEAARRLNDDRWYVIRNMMYILREAGGKGDIHHIRHFVRHGHKRICMEALRSLIHFKTSDAISYLKLYMKSDDPDVRALAVRLAGVCKYREAVPAILDLLKKKHLLSTDMEFKVLIVKILGEIGDPAAIPLLDEIYKSSSILHGSTLEHLKVEIFRSLSQYPLEETTPLLEAGLGSKNHEIRSISELLLRGGRPERSNEEDI